MKKILSKTSVILFILLSGMLVTMCSGGHKAKSDKSETEQDNSAVPQPLNISVFLDLSDRLTRDLTPSQMERDTAIIDYLIDLFIDDCKTNGKIVNSKNHFQIFFYPAPASSGIAKLAKGLNVDMSKTDLKQKKVELMEMKKRFQTTLTQIYSDAISEHKWVGCDIWGFFSNREVDKLCVRKGYRNILVILTDGYLFHKDNKIKEGNAYSYILPQTLEIGDASLIVRRKGLSDLEVLILEVNPYNPKQRDALVPTLEQWLSNMEISNFLVNETTLPVNTETYIDNFFKIE